MRLHAKGRQLSVRILLFVGTSLAGSITAQAQTKPEPQAGTTAAPSVGDIIVTANRRAERLQDVPMSINVLSNDTLKASGVTDSAALASMVPGLSLTKTNSTQYYLRGIGTANTSINSEQSVASYVDGVYVFSTYGSLPLANVERVEVLRGPQGTLFGRNTTGGVIQAVTRDPLAPTKLDATLGYGNYEMLAGTFYGNAHLADNLGISLAAEYRDQGKGFGRNTTRNEDSYKRDDWSIQGKVAYEPSDRTTLTAFFQYRRTKDSGLNYAPIAGTRSVDGVDGSDYGRYETRSESRAFARIHDYLAYGKIAQDIGDFATLTSITSYRKISTLVPLDLDGTPLKVFNAVLQDRYHNFSQEVQLGSSGTGPLTWVVGGFYFDSSAGYKPVTLDSPGALARLFHKQTTRSLSGFGQMTYDIAGGPKLTAGVRYTDEKQKLPASNYTLIGTGANEVRLPFLPDSVDSSGWTWRLAIDQDVTEGVKAFASYNRGLKSGGFSLVAVQNLPAVRPETLDAYETGLKMEFLGGKLRINPSIFLYKFKDIQVSIIRANIAVTENAAAATVKGFDLDAAYQVTDRLQINGAFEYLDSNFDSYPNAVSFIPNPAPFGASTELPNQNAAGKRLPYAPKTSGSAGMSYVAPLGGGEVRFDGTVRYVGKQYSSATNLYALPAYTLVNAGISWTTADERYSVRVWGDNMFDKRYRSQILDSALGIFRIEGAPRTYGITLGVKM